MLIRIFAIKMSPILFLLLMALPASAKESFCRIGINHTSPNIPQIDLVLLGAGWYMDYWATPKQPYPNGMEYVATVRLSKYLDSYTYDPGIGWVTATAKFHPGSDWLIGNEPDVRIYQDDLEPELYAVAYHDLYKTIKGIDSSAKIFAGNITQATPLRMSYLDRVIAEYRRLYGEQMPVDGWAIHGYILNEASCDHYTNCWGAGIPPGMIDDRGEIITGEDSSNIKIFERRVVDFRQWMKSNGYRDRPLYVSEHGLLTSDNAEVINRYMNETFNYMLSARDQNIGLIVDDNRLIQKFAWFSTGYYMSGRLFDQNTGGEWKLTENGKNYIRYTDMITPVVDLSVEEISVITSTNGITVNAKIMDTGNRQAYTATVSFFEYDSGNKILLNKVNLEMSGCAESKYVSFFWKNGNPNTYKVYVDATADYMVDRGDISKYIFYPRYTYWLPFVGLEN